MKREIEIEGLPEGWELVKVAIGNSVCFNDNGSKDIVSTVTVREIKPRQIVFEETDVKNAKVSFYDDLGMWTYWKIVDEKEDKHHG